MGVAQAPIAVEPIILKLYKAIRPIIHVQQDSVEMISLRCDDIVNIHEA